MDLGERTLSTEVLYRGKVLDLHVDQVELPGGRVTSREAVRHSPAVAVVAVEGDKVYLVRQFRHAVGDFILEIPAGIVEAGETPLQTAAREIQEEIAMKAENLEEIGRIYTSPGFCDEEIVLFWAEGLSPSRLPADDDEFIQVEKVPLSQVWSMIDDGVIKDGKTVVALYRMALKGKIAYH
nr:NUDIX hydrolase [uncultured Dethiosulfovibrio sp.]